MLGAKGHWAQAAGPGQEELRGWFALFGSPRAEGNYPHFSRMDEALTAQPEALRMVALEPVVAAAGFDAPCRLVVQACPWVESNDPRRPVVQACLWVELAGARVRETRLLECHLGCCG